MAIRTRIAPMYAGQKIFAAILFAVFGVWGAYDYWVKIPRREAAANEFEAITARLKELEGRTLTQEQQQEVIANVARMQQLSPRGEAPARPGKWDRTTQWFFIACLPFAPVFFMAYAKAKRQRYVLDDEGTLHFAGDKQHGSGAWRAEEIADIDMNRWMAKSIAYAVRADGRRLMLDAYLHKDLHLIIGAIASRMYPDQWDAEAKMVKRGGSPQNDGEIEPDPLPEQPT